MRTRITRSRALVLALATLVGGVLLPGAASAQTSGATDVDINLPSVIVLHYFSNVDLTISGTVLQSWLGATDDQGTATATGAVSGTAIQTDLDISSATDFSPDNVPTAMSLNLLNAWAVRSLAGSSGSTQVAIANTDGTLEHSSGDTITVSSVGVRQAGGGAFGADTSFSPTGLSSPQLGDVQLVLDLSSATSSGDYLDGVFTLTVTNI